MELRIAEEPRSSFHTTICVLEGLLEYERAVYDVLRALDYLRGAGVQPDVRIGDALHVVEGRQQADGRWLLDRAHDEALAFPFAESVGEPSRWNTLRALRVLRWCERARLEPTSLRA